MLVSEFQTKLIATACRVLLWLHCIMTSVFASAARASRTASWPIRHGPPEDVVARQLLLRPAKVQLCQTTVGGRWCQRCLWPVQRSRPCPAVLLTSLLSHACLQSGVVSLPGLQVPRVALGVRRVVGVHPRGDVRPRYALVRDAMGREDANSSTSNRFKV